MAYFNHMLRTQIYLPQELYRDIDLVAKEEKKATAQVIRELLADGLSHKKKVTIGKALLKLTQVKAHAPADTSMKIDDYLYNL
jgi:metal-responsive CopG/Arc/MetJ family transcriptional regulator